MEANERLAAVIQLVEEARGVPLSASCVVHRADILEQLELIKVALPQDLSFAQDVLKQQNEILENAQASADAIIEQGREVVAAMVLDTQIVAAAKIEARNIIEAANVEALGQQDRTDEYIDNRLATLEVILNKSLEAIAKGRDRLAGIDNKSLLKDLDDEK